MPPPATPRASALAASATADADEVYGSETLMEDLQSYLTRKGSFKLQDFTSIPHIYTVPVLERFGFRRRWIHTVTFHMYEGYADFIMEGGNPVRGRGDSKVVPGMAFEISGTRCELASRAKRPTCFSTPSFVNNTVGPCSFCRARGSELHCTAREVPFLDADERAMDETLVNECLKYELWLQEQALVLPQKRRAGDGREDSTPPSTPLTVRVGAVPPRSPPTTPVSPVSRGDESANALRMATPTAPDLFPSQKISSPSPSPSPSPSQCSSHLASKLRNTLPSRQTISRGEVGDHETDTPSEEHQRKVGNGAEELSAAQRRIVDLEGQLAHALRLGEKERAEADRQIADERRRSETLEVENAALTRELKRVAHDVINAVRPRLPV